MNEFPSCHIWSLPKFFLSFFHSILRYYDSLSWVREWVVQLCAHLAIFRVTQYDFDHSSIPFRTLWFTILSLGIGCSSMLSSCKILPPRTTRASRVLLHVFVVFFLCYKVVWNPSILYTSEALFLLCFWVEPCVVVSPCSLLLCVLWFGAEPYARLRSGRDDRLVW